MGKAKLYNQSGKEIKELSLPAALFGVAANPILVSEVVTALLANQRQAYAHTKGRSEVRGGGRKPWRQKGTGRARHGSIRSPLWRGGGITFGPTKEANYTKKINKKAKQKALLIALSDRVAQSKLLVIDQLQLSAIKTKEFLSVLNKFPQLTARSLFIIDKKDEQIEKSARNLPRVDVCTVSGLSLLTVLDHEYIVFTEPALQIFIKKYQ